jgi:probable phosphoglycerate mutase
MGEELRTGDSGAPAWHDMRRRRFFMELWLVRHGETTFGAQRRLAGWADPPLSDKGEHEAEALRPFLNGHHFDSVWSSDLQRAITTSRLAWGQVSADQRLREINFGDLEGCAFEEIDLDMARALLAFQEFAAPNGESLTETRTRIDEFLHELGPGRHLLFVHGGVIRLLTRHLGVDRFVATGTVVGVDWDRQRLLFVHPEASEYDP